MDDKELTIMLVEDDVELGEVIRDYLEQESYCVSWLREGTGAAERILKEQPSLLILDVMLPGEDGISICKRIRESYHGMILMFTAREDEIDQIVGLELGADDYLIKPVKPRLLLAKIKSLLRRETVSPKKAHSVTLGKLNVDVRGRNVTLDDVTIELTAAEFDVLALLAIHAGDTLSREFISRELKGTSYDGLERTIDNKISQLRRKLGDNAKTPHKIKTIRAKGYVLMAEVWQ
mgnify:CR=1 FL=1